LKTRASKTNKSIEIRLDDWVLVLIKAHILLNNLGDNDKMFRMDRTTLYRAMSTAGKEIGLEETLGAHSIRKTKAFHLFKIHYFSGDVVATT
jgi:integrase